MRRIFMLLVLAAAVTLTGCSKHKLTDFVFKPGLTAEQFEAQAGRPSRRDAHWIAYAMEDGTELRVFFGGGVHGSTYRTLTEASLYSKEGNWIKNVYAIPQSTTNPLLTPVTLPTSQPTSNPTSKPATRELT